MGYSISQLFSICWATFEFLIALGGIGGTVYLLVELGNKKDVQLEGTLPVIIVWIFF